MELRQIGYDEVEVVGDAVVASSPNAINTVMTYTAPCLVGQILKELGVPIDQLEGRDDHQRVSQVNWGKCGVIFTQKALKLLGAVQRRADFPESQPWGLAWVNGKEYTSGRAVDG